MQNYNRYFYNKKILIAGGSGFIGQNLCKKLFNLGANITLQYLNNEPLEKKDNISYIKSDLTIKNNCLKILKDIDIVFMCAANSSGAKIMKEKPLDHLTPNLIMNSLMLESAYLNKVKKFIFISSNTVYPLTNFPVKEEDSNFSFYKSYYVVGWMKKFSEIMCAMYSNEINQPMTTIIIRPGNIYGKHDKFDWEKSKVVPALIRKCVEKHNPIEVWGNGNDVKDFLYIDDFIEGLLLSACLINNFEIINLASGKEITIKKILSMIMDITKHRANINYDKTKPSMIPKRLINIDKAKKLLNFNQKILMYEGLKKTIDWYKRST